MLRVGGGVGGFMEFDADFKFAKIQNSYVEGKGGGDLWNLMLSSNLLKSKIPISMSPPPENGNFSSGLDLENYLKMTFRNCFQVPE